MIENSIFLNKKNIDRASYVRALLNLHKIKGVDIAKEAGVTFQMVSRVLRGTGTSTKVERVIARKLNVEYEELWGRKPRRKAA
ncbi:MAG: LacI family DNA-binding transcriptional regulator [Candidatus Gracilibacteria bacterium]|nr:LacI family DNA-binding transcriptional regulator [Candidatus Gracilibacteria bacterium]